VTGSRSAGDARQRRLLALAAILAGSLCLSLTPGLVKAPASGAVAASAGSAASTDKVVTREDVDANGTSTTVDRRDVRVTVSQTKDLRDQQVIDVAWSGAHPTAGITPDPVNWGNDGIRPWAQEYPFVLMQCRGLDDPLLPAPQQLSQQTCYTQYRPERTGAGAATVSTDYPAWRLDTYATATDRTPEATRPAGVPTECARGITHWLPFVAADGVVYPTGGTTPACGAQAPEGSPGNAVPPLPSNTIYATTDTAGRGSASFEVRSSATNSSLGCSETVACSLVMVPIEGVSCDARLIGQDSLGALSGVDALRACRKTGDFAPGQRLFNPAAQAAAGGGEASLSVEGTYWWSASNWRNRISVPLSLLPAGNFCDIRDKRTPVDVYGSELLAEATQSWAPKFCSDPSLFHFRHARIGEPTAKNLLTQGTVDAAFISAPPPGGYLVPTVNAPVALTSFAIGFSVDGQDGQARHDLKLTPRLLAKLLTNSYPGFTSTRDYEFAISHNPLNITYDPEFQGLNPGVPLSANPFFGPAAATLTYLASDSDVMGALTAYISADPEARSWLDGRPDPWGAVVNPAYRGIGLPTESWRLRDTFIDRVLADATDESHSCYHDNPTPTGTLLSAPVSALSAISPVVRYASPTSLTQCLVLTTSTDGTKRTYGLKPFGPEPAGSRFVLGLVSTADAELFGLPTAALQTQILPTAAARFTDATGRSFVTPSDASLRAAVSYLVPSATTGTWPVPYSTLHTSPGAVGAYPGTMVVYAAVPTTGLAPTTAADLAKLLRFAATDGQIPGTAIAQLPAGYLPMTQTNGLGGLAAYTLKAADAVGAQTGQVPAVAAAPAPAPAPAQSTGTAQPTPQTPAVSRARTRGATPSVRDRSSPPAAVRSTEAAVPATPAARGAGAPAPPVPLGTASDSGATPASATAGASAPAVAGGLSPPQVPPALASAVTTGVAAGAAAWLLPLVLGVALAGVLAMLVAGRGPRRRPGPAAS